MSRWCVAVALWMAALFLAGPASAVNFPAQELGPAQQVDTGLPPLVFSWAFDTARDAVGNTVVVWRVEESGVPNKIYLRRYGVDGQPLGDAEVVATAESLSQALEPPALAVASDGRFVVTWSHTTFPPMADVRFQVHARRYDADGQALGAPFAVSQEYVSGGFSDRLNADVAMADDGSFVITWMAWNVDAEGNVVPGYGAVYARRYGTDGSSPGGAFVANTIALDFVRWLPKVAADAQGNFVLVWSNKRPGETYVRIQFRRFAANGSAQDAAEVQMPVNAAHQYYPSVARAADGRFAIVCFEPTTTGITGNIPLRVFDAAGVEQGTGVYMDALNATVELPIVSMSDTGVIAVAWAGTVGNPPDVPDAVSRSAARFRMFDAAGNAMSVNPIPVEPTTYPILSYGPVPALDADGDLAMVYGFTPTRVSPTQLMLKRYSGPESVDLAVFQLIGDAFVLDGGTEHYTVYLGNLHPYPGTPDSPLGAATHVTAFMSLPIGATNLQWANDAPGRPGWSCVTDESGLVPFVSCDFTGDTGLGAGVLGTGVEISPIAFSFVPPSGATSAAVDAQIHGDQFDPDEQLGGSANNYEQDIFRICAAGEGGTFRFVGTVDQTITEGQDVTLTVERIGGSCGYVSAQVTLPFPPSGSGSIVLLFNDGVSGTKSATFTAVGADAVDEPTEVRIADLLISGGGPDGAAVLGAPNKAQITILDDEPPASLVNSRFAPPVLSDKLTNNPPVPEGPAGYYQFTSKFCLNAGAALTGLFSRTTQLTNNNSLISRTRHAPSGPPGGVGSEQDFLPKDGYSDGVLAGGECVDVRYDIGLATKAAFSFKVNVMGNMVP